MNFLASFMNLAGPDLIVILLIILVLFGAKKLPELARGMGQAVKEFQKAKDQFNDELHQAGKSETETAKVRCETGGIDRSSRREPAHGQFRGSRSKSDGQARRQSRSGVELRLVSPISPRSRESPLSRTALPTLQTV